MSRSEYTFHKAHPEPELRVSSYPYYTANATGTNYGAGGGIYARGGRGMPDVAANGAYLNAYVAGELNNWFGTSLASPIFASVINLVS